MSQFKLVSPFQPMGDQVQAIQELVDGLKAGKKEQVLLGGTGTGKTFTVANVIKEYNKPALVLAHNKTLAGQLYSDLKEFFPENRVECFISNCDFINQKLIFQVGISILIKMQKQIMKLKCCVQQQ